MVVSDSDVDSKSDTRHEEEGHQDMLHPSHEEAMLTSGKVYLGNA